MCDAAAVGEICSSPAALAFLEAFRAADGGRGIACLYGNYSGDNMNVKMAVKMAKREGLTVKTVVANDDGGICAKRSAGKSAVALPARFLCGNAQELRRQRAVH